MASGTKKERLRQRKRTQQKNYDRVTDQIRGAAVQKLGPQVMEKGTRVQLGASDRSPNVKRPQMQQPRSADGSGSEIVVGDYLGPDVSKKAYDARVALNRRAAAQKARRNRG